MGTLTTTCPSCKTEKIALKTLSSASSSRIYSGAYIWWQCPNPACYQPGAALIVNSTNTGDAELYKNNLVVGHQIALKEIWPNHDQADIPDHIPPKVSKALHQAENNFPNPEMAESSGIMYRRALELAIKTIDEDGKGELVKRIRQAANKGFLTKDIADWAHNIRILGNDATHDMEGINQDELKALRGLTKSVLQYVFTLPNEVKILKERTALPEDDNPAKPVDDD